MVAYYNTCRAARVSMALSDFNKCYSGINAALKIAKTVTTETKFFITAI